MSDKPKFYRPLELIERSWRKAIEFEVIYPIGKSEQQKLVHAVPIYGRCGECGALRK